MTKFSHVVAAVVFILMYRYFYFASPSVFDECFVHLESLLMLRNTVTVLAWLLPVGTINFRPYLPADAIRGLDSINFSPVQHALQSCGHHRNAHDWSLCMAQLLGTLSCPSHPCCQQWVWLRNCVGTIWGLIFFTSSEQLCAGLIQRRVEESRKYNYLHLALSVGTMPSTCQSIPLQDVAHLPNTFSLIMHILGNHTSSCAPLEAPCSACVWLRIFSCLI